MNGVRQEQLYFCVQEMHQKGYAVSEICDILSLDRSSYYKCACRSESRREIENKKLMHEISDLSIDVLFILVGRTACVSVLHKTSSLSMKGSC